MNAQESRIKNRLSALRAGVKDAGADAFVSLAQPDNQYLTGFIGTTSAVVVTADEALFLCDFRYTEQAHVQVRGLKIEEVKGGFIKGVCERMNSLKIASAAYEPSYLTMAQYKALEAFFRGKLISAPEIVGVLRMVKDSHEIKLIRDASHLAEGVMTDLVSDLKPGVTEAELAARFEYEFKRRGAQGASFDSIILFGARSSMPHGAPSGKPLERGDIILLDFGCRKGGYCSDLTRTFAYGTIPGAWFSEIYDVVYSAQKAALRAVRPGVRCRDVDAVARAIIADAGYGQFFGHGLGHGVGVEIHESPRLNPESQVILREGMVVTVEPGIYLPERGGVRIEDLVVVGKSGCSNLARTDKKLDILPI
jgi:Xaa-Pro aminopeptidase